MTLSYFFFQAEEGIRGLTVTGVQTCALPISGRALQPYAVEPDQHRERLDAREQGERTGEPVRGAAVCRDLQGLHAISLCPDRTPDHVDRRGQGIDPQEIERVLEHSGLDGGAEADRDRAER